MMFASDPDTDVLLREATAHADAKRWDDAICALQQAAQRMARSPVDYPVETWLRLPLYLQRAGRFVESMSAFDEVDAQTPARIARFFGHKPADWQARAVAEQRAVIATKRALASRREAARQKKTKT